MVKDKNKRPFRVLIPLLISQTIGAFSDNGMKAMLPLMAAIQFGKESMDQVNQMVSLLLIIPFVVFAPWAGWISDRFSKKKVVSHLLLGQVFGLGLLAYALFIENLMMAVIGFFLLGVQSAFFSPGKKGILKELVGSERLGMAVGWMEMLTMVGILGGAFLSASYFDLLAQVHSGWKSGFILAMIAMGLTIFSWLLFILTPKTKAPRADPFHPRVLWSHWFDLKELWKDRGLRGAAIGDAWFWSVGSFFYLILVKLSGEVVEGEIGMGGLYGYWFFLLGLGIMTGSLFVAYLNRGRVELGLTPIGAVLLPLALLLLYFVNPFDDLFQYGCVLLGFSGALFVVPLNGFMQDQARESERGRVLAASNLLTQISSIGLILFHAFLSYLGFSAKQELLIMSVPACLVAYLSLRFILEDFFRAWFHIFLRVFYRIRIVGLENFPNKHGVVLVSNHLSYADPVFIGAAFPRKIRYLAYSGLTNSSIMRFVFKITDTITVSPQHSFDSMKSCVRRLKEGLPLCVFAEGGISRTGSIFPFKRGVLLLARQAKVPIVPVHIDGVWGSVFSMERGKFFYKRPLRFPYRISVRIGTEIDAGLVAAENVRIEVMNLGRESFSERIPSTEKAQDLIIECFKISPNDDFIFFENQLVFTRGEMAQFLQGEQVLKNKDSIPKECGDWITGMLSLFQEVKGSAKIWSSFVRITETHLWDQDGFKFEINQYLDPKWILWVAYIGKRKLLFKDGFLSVFNSKKIKSDHLSLVNALSTERNGLVSINFKSIAECKGQFDELEHGFKKNSLGRLLPGLSYCTDPDFGIIGIDGVIDRLSKIKGLDNDGFLEVN